MTTLEILKGARELIATPEKWTKNHFARTESGEALWSGAVVAKDPRCACFCLSGALLLVSGLDFVGELKQELVALGFTNPEELYLWNDHPSRTHAEVLARLDSAIASEEAKVPHA